MNCEEGHGKCIVNYRRQDKGEEGAEKFPQVNICPYSRLSTAHGKWRGNLFIYFLYILLLLHFYVTLGVVFKENK